MLVRDTRGFTLIELMVVVVILGILAGLIIPKIMGRPEEAKRLKAKMQIESADITAIRLMLDALLRVEQGRYYFFVPSPHGEDH
jgi:type II secretion system protein G